MNARLMLSILCLALATAVGAAREFLFVNLNYQIDFLAQARDRNYAHSQFRRWVGEMSLNEAVLAKWLLAAAFMAIILLLTLAMARIRFGDHRYDRRILITFVVLGSLAIFGHLVAPVFAPMRPISIAILHGLQYPVPVLLAWVVSWVRPH
jgi:hypothetical protein